MERLKLIPGWTLSRHAACWLEFEALPRTENALASVLNLTKARPRSNALRRTAQHPMVQYVERLNIDLHCEALPDREQPVDRHVPTQVVRRMD